MITTLLVLPAEPKPKACNFGLFYATGEIVTIYDAEDLPESLQLRRVAVAFSRLSDDVACVQAELAYHNGKQNMLTGWFTAECALWFGFHSLYGFAIVAASDNPRTFVVPSDTDFVKMLNDPAGNGIRYLLTVPREPLGIADAINERYPTIYDTGAEIATLEVEFRNDSDNQPVWRLYRVNER